VWREERAVDLSVSPPIITHLKDNPKSPDFLMSSRYCVSQFSPEKLSIVDGSTSTTNSADKHGNHLGNTSVAN